MVSFLGGPETCTVKNRKGAKNPQKTKANLSGFRGASMGGKNHRQVRESQILFPQKPPDQILFGKQPAGNTRLQIRVAPSPCRWESAFEKQPKDRTSLIQSVVAANKHFEK